MLIDTRRQRSVFAALHLERVFDLVHRGGHDRRAPNRHPAPVTRQSKECETDHSHSLFLLLESLGMEANAAAASVQRSDADTARAATNIAEWMTYLPENCVKTMVSEGWHWST